MCLIDQLGQNPASLVYQSTSGAAATLRLQYNMRLLGDSGRMEDKVINLCVCRLFTVASACSGEKQYLSPKIHDI